MGVAYVRDVRFSGSAVDAALRVESCPITVDPLM